jgi:SAM-dependent methyltransferase
METFNYREYWNSRLSGNFGLEAVGYIGLGKAFNNWMYKVRRVIFLRYLKKLPIDFTLANVLDIASGTGFYIQLWRSLSVKKITGVDISQQAVLNLSNKFPAHEFKVVDISAEQLPNAEFDLISCMDLFFHIVEKDKFEYALNSISCALKKGGYLIFTDNFLHREPQRLAHHVSRTLAEYENVLHRNNLRIVSRRPVFYFLNYPVDSNNRALHFLWKVFLKFIPANNFFGRVCGLILYPFELLMVSLVNEGPSTEMMICEKQ